MYLNWIAVCMHAAVMWDTTDGGSEHYTSAPDTEDEGDAANSWFQGHQLQSVLKEEGSTSPALAKSYAKLEKSVLHKSGSKDKWHDWFQLQADWVNNVEEYPEHYFDDYL